MPGPAQTNQIIDTVHQLATQATGLDDFGDEDYQEGLRVLVDSCIDDAKIDNVLQSVPGQMAIGSLMGRLVAHRQWADNPQWRDVQVQRPIIVVGMVRTATTAIHRLLAEDPRNQAPEYWLLRAPQPRPPRDTWSTNPGFVGCDQALNAMYQVDPGFKDLHDIQAHLVDECWPVLQQRLTSSIFDFVFPRLHGYREWLNGNDQTPAYQWHRDVLRLIFSGTPDRRWVLKCPTHLFFPEALFNVYPDALIVQTHRHPRKAVPSGASVISRFRQAAGETIEPEFGQFQVDVWARSINAFLEVRKTRSPEQFFDVYVQDFARDPMGVVRDMHAHFGLDLTDDASTRMQSWVTANPRGGHGEHSYSLHDFGIDERRVDSAFESYIEEFGLRDQVRA
jgi:hypothetical protein